MFFRFIKPVRLIMSFSGFIMLLSGLIVSSGCMAAANNGWYTEGSNAHTTRIELTLVNTLDFDRTSCPVVIPREQLPLRDLMEMGITVVDPSLPARPMPSPEVLRRQGGHNIRAETNGQQLSYQADDLDKDGVWDELFFQANLKARERKTIYLYIGFNQQGWMEHGTHANIGSYCHHLIPFWESAHVGWKLWYTDSCDVYGKRKGVLMSNLLYMNNLDGYNVSTLNRDYGSDIARVSTSFGGGAICLFENPSMPDSVSRPRFTQSEGKKVSPKGWNQGPLSDTRYSYDVVVNGPVRSIIKVKTMNWNSGNGSYELEQFYTAYTNQSYSTCTVRYTKFLPLNAGTVFGCGIRKNQSEFEWWQNGGIAITCGKDRLSDPDDPEGKPYIVEFVGNAIVVKDKYKPQYRSVSGFDGNHTFAIPLTKDLSYEYMIFGAWDEGEVYNTPELFREYVIKTAKEYNNPVKVVLERVETKQAGINN
jgi:hypothetical protein